MPNEQSQAIIGLALFDFGDTMANKVELKWERLHFHCPGCKRAHCITLTGSVKWTWNGSFDLPTFSPSILYEPSIPQHRCHFFVREGKIQYLEDCHHVLKGQTVDMPDWETQWLS